MNTDHQYLKQFKEKIIITSVCFVLHKPHKINTDYDPLKIPLKEKYNSKYSKRSNQPKSQNYLIPQKWEIVVVSLKIQSLIKINS